MHDRYELDSSEYIKGTQKAYQRIAEKFDAEMWGFLAESLDEWETLVRADEREKAARRVIYAVGAHPTHMTEHDKALVAAARGGEQE